MTASSDHSNLLVERVRPGETTAALDKFAFEFAMDHHAYPAPPTPEPIPIATSGELNLMPPSTGLPVSNSTLTPVLDSIPHIPDPEPATADIAGNEASHHG